MKRKELPEGHTFVAYMRKCTQYPGYVIYRNTMDGKRVSEEYSQDMKCVCAEEYDSCDTQIEYDKTRQGYWKEIIRYFNKNCTF